MREVDLSSFLPPRARALLHFGCRSGRTAEHFRRIQPDCRYTGVTPERERAAGLLPFLDAVMADPSGMADPGRCGMRNLDAILYEGEAVARLTAEDLRRHAASLAPGGQVVLAAENPSYLGNFLAALGGESVLPGKGRALAELRAMVGQAGLALDRVRPLYRREDDALRNRPAVESLVRAAEAWRKEQGAGAQDLWAEAFILVAVREAPPSPILVQGLLGEALVTAKVRLADPHDFLATEPGIRYSSGDKTLDLAQARNYERKILIRQRVHFGSAEEARRSLGALREMGYLLVYEIDDNPKRWQKEHENSQWLDYRGSHACQVSTRPLAEALRQYNPHVKVFRNELRELPVRRDYREGEPVTVFFGALNREEDWKDILPALNEAAERYGEGLRFRVLADKAFFAALRTERKEFIGDNRYYEGKYVPYPVYADALHRSDISLLPLHDTEFNRMKSDLKFIESAGHGAVVLASPTVYEGSVRDGETGFLYRSPREFADRLRILVEDRPRRLAMAEAAYRYVAAERLLSQHYEERRDWYEELFARREELERDLDARLAKDWKKE